MTSEAHEIDDGIDVEEDEEVVVVGDDDEEDNVDDDDDDDQLSSLSSNIDTIIVSESGETKYFNASGEEQEEHPSVKKKKSCDTTLLDGELNNSNKSSMSTQEAKNNITNGHQNAANKNSPTVDVRIIDFAHTTFTSKEPSPFLNESETKKIHHGPDGGFLTGISSLKRILSEIIVEAI
jgi:glucan-binding YG repeat protein